MAPIEDIIESCKSVTESYARGIPEYGEYIRQIIICLKTGFSLERQLIPSGILALREELMCMDPLGFQSRQMDQKRIALHQALHDAGYCPYETEYKGEIE